MSSIGRIFRVTSLIIIAGRSMLIALAQNTSTPIGDPVLEVPTLHSLGIYWVIAGDENRNAKVEVEYRRLETERWKKGPPLFRVEKSAHQPESKLPLPENSWLFAGSLLSLEPDAPYELRLTLSDPDGGYVQRVVRSKTIAEPRLPTNAPIYHVVPGNGGGTGTEFNPYRGLQTAHANAKPGHIFLLHAGIYKGTFTISCSGQPGKPIVWRGAEDGEVIIDAQTEEDKRPERAISASDVHDVWFENLTIRNAVCGLVAHNSFRLVIRRCHIYKVDYGIVATNNDKQVMHSFFIADNVIEGPSTWPRTKGIESARGIQITGTGHVVCYNRLSGFADGIDTFPSPQCAAIDFHNNDISEMTDDGIELDYSERNIRCFLNRLTNVFQGISAQPVYGGPAYIFRNALYNVSLEPFKLHNSPSGVLIIHNTCVKKGMPFVLWTNEPVHNCFSRNNLFIGGSARYAFESTAPMINCDFDYDGFGGGPWEYFLKWNEIRYQTFEEVRQKAPVYKHLILVNPNDLFISGLLLPDDETKQFPNQLVDLRLKPGSSAIDAGTVLLGFNDGYRGKAPDLGAYELGDLLPHYGPRPKNKGR